MITLSGINPENINWPELRKRSCRADILRLDKIHPVVSGNKWFKLKYYLEDMRAGGYKTLVTFGGAYSNHIVAAASAAQAAAIPALGIIRGEAPAELSPTLLAASDYGMKLVFVSRESYKRKQEDPLIRKIIGTYPGAYIIPEGGAGANGVRGAGEILLLFNPADYTHIFCAVGTGTTFAGILNAAAQGQQVIGIPVLKGMQDSIPELQDMIGKVRKMTTEFQGPPQKYGPFTQEKKEPGARFFYDYHFGGYAKRTPALLNFMNEFYQESGVPSDFVYTGKLFYAFADILKKGLIEPGSRVLLLHSGGLQGNCSLPSGTLLF